MKKFLMVLALTAMAFLGTAVPAYADEYTAICDDSQLDPAVKDEICNTTVNDNRNLMTVIQGIVNVAIGVIGIAAVVVIVMAGQRYITAQGDPGKLKMAKDMILWGIIGLVVALLAYAIVNFIVVSVPGETA